ncbi:MAG: hypothetical protein Tsb0020_32640 [Haliangiales bacterium]
MSKARAVLKIGRLLPTFADIAVAVRHTRPERHAHAVTPAYARVHRWARHCLNRPVPARFSTAAPSLGPWRLVAASAAQCCRPHAAKHSHPERWRRDVGHKESAAVMSAARVVSPAQRRPLACVGEPSDGPQRGPLANRASL